MNDNVSSKYEEIIAPEVEQFCYITDNTYVKEEVGNWLLILAAVLYVCLSWFWFEVLNNTMDAGFANGIFCAESLEVSNDSSNDYVLFEVMSSFVIITQTGTFISVSMDIDS